VPGAGGPPQARVLRRRERHSPARVAAIVERLSPCSRRRSTSAPGRDLGRASQLAARAVSSAPDATCARSWHGFVRQPRQTARVAVLDPSGAICRIRYDTRRSAFIGPCPEVGWSTGETLLQAARRELLEERPAGTISNPALNYGPGGTTSRTTGNPRTSSSESSWGTGHAVTRRVTYPQLTPRTESCMAMVVTC
jgi:hypothetical protein